MDILGTGYRLPTTPGFAQENEDIPGYWIALFDRAVDTHSASATPSRSLSEDVAVAFQDMEPLGIRNRYAFSELTPRPISLAALRIASAVTATVARTRYRPAELTLTGRVSHPLGKASEFRLLTAYLTPFRPAGPGRDP